MSETIFQIGASGIDTEAIVHRIRKSVKEKIKNGLYSDARVARAERTNLANLKNDEEFLSVYLESLHDAVFVDISDYEIFERRTRCSRIFIAIKRFLWKLLKFYTYRLWSQQNQINGLLLSTVEEIDRTYQRRLQQLESRLRELESRRPAP